MHDAPPNLGKSPHVDILKGFHHVATGTTKLIRATALMIHLARISNIWMPEDAGEGN
jgi:hypothetical protein